MKTTVTLNSFVRDFMAIRPDNFTPEGLEVLFDYLQDYEDQTGEEMEFDVIGLCCDFAEDSPYTIAEDYGIDISECESALDVAEIVSEYLSDEGALIGEADGTLVYRCF